MLANKLMSALSGAEDKLYVDDVFSTYLYTGNGTTQTINNGIDLAGKGGLVWTKSRTARDHYLIDSNGGRLYGHSSNTTDAKSGFGNINATFGNSDGYRFINAGNTNISGENFISWTFRKAPKFFDVVTYTGNGVAGRQIAHELGVAPGMVIIKRTDSGHGWEVWHRGNGAAVQLMLNHTKAGGSGYDAWVSAANITTFTVNGDVTTSGGILYSSNDYGGTYVAYLFAHDPSADGFIQCGSYTGNGSATGPIVNLGWEPQYLMVKNASGTGNWQIIDNMRGMAVGSADATLQANLSGAEASADYVSPTATGFQVTSTSSEVNTNGSTYIYLAIRRPNKPPTTGTEVYNAIARTGTGAAATVTGVGFAPDLALISSRNGTNPPTMYDRLRGGGYLFSNLTGSERNEPVALAAWDTMDGVKVQIDGVHNGSNVNYINHFFRRAPGFFDVVCYTGTGVARTVPHNLGVAPELMIVKGRSLRGHGWYMYLCSAGNTAGLSLNTINATTDGVAWWNNTSPTATEFSLGRAAALNGWDSTYVAYLFASLPGISKVGSYTGNGTTQTINCGFSTGARFILIKRTDSTGDWYIWDTARGIVSANDPHLSLNTGAAEVTTDDSVDPDVSGFIVNQVAATNINVSGGQYIFLAIA